MYNELKEINLRPKPFQFYTADALWTDEHISQKMLEYHLDESVDLSSRNKEFIERSVKWIVSHFGIDTHTAPMLPVNLSTQNRQSLQSLHEN